MNARKNSHINFHWIKNPIGTKIDKFKNDKN